MPTTIGTLIAAARYEQEWTQDDLADAMSAARGWNRSFTREQVARLEAGRMIYRPESDKREPLWWALRVLKIELVTAKGLL